MAMGTRKIGPAVAAGCTMVIKPAQQTPLSMLALAAILAEAGLPDGVLNVVTTGSAGKVMEPLIRDGRARKLSFTGSTEVGRALLEQAADKVLRTSMELGGNAPFLVFADADLDAAVEGAMTAKMRNMGEACTAANRFFVHRSVADAFADKLAERMARAAGRAAAPTTASRWARWSTRRAGRRSSSSSATPSTAARPSASAASPSTGPAASTGPPCSPTCRSRPG